MRFLPQVLPGVIVVEPDVHRDDRGFFFESYHARRYGEAGISPVFVQDNHSRSVRATLRGLHARRSRPEGKLVRVLRGEIFDVAVDLRRASPTFGRWTGVVLSETNFRQVYIPPGCAHGYCVTGDCAEVAYKCTEHYDPDDEITLFWNDPGLRIDWPVRDPILSPRDRAGRLLAELVDLLPPSR